MICVINFHYQVFINLFILCRPDASLLGVYHHLGCVCLCVCLWALLVFFFPPPKECFDHGKFHVHSGGTVNVCVL